MGPGFIFFGRRHDIRISIPFFCPGRLLLPGQLPVLGRDPCFLLFPTIARLRFEVMNKIGYKTQTTAMCMLPANDFYLFVYHFVYAWLLVSAAIHPTCLCFWTTVGLSAEIRRWSCKQDSPFANRSEIDHLANRAEWCFLTALLRGTGRSKC